MATTKKKAPARKAPAKRKATAAAKAAASASKGRAKATTKAKAPARAAKASTGRTQAPAGDLVAAELIQLLPIGQVSPGDNVRSNLGDLGDLVASIKAQGILQPIVVRQIGDGYKVLFGHRRLAAAKAAKLKTVPAVVRKVTNANAAAQMLVENLQRADLDPFDEAVGYHRLITEHKLSQGAAAKLVGRAQSHVSKRLALLQVPPAARPLIAEGVVQVNEGAKLAKLGKLPDEAQRKAIATMKRRRSNGGDAQVEQVIRETSAAAARAAKRAELVATAERDPAPYLDKLPEGARFVGGDGFNVVAVPISKHRKLDCHAVTVTDEFWSEPKLRYVCIRPDDHLDAAEAKAQTKAERERNAEAQRRREDTRLRAEAQAARIAFLAQAPASADTAVQLLLPAALDDFRDGWWGSGERAPGQLACEVLGLEVPTPAATDDDGDPLPDYVGALQAEADRSKAARTRVAQAVGAEVLEAQLRPGARDRTAARAYFGALGELGYKISNNEAVDYTDEPADG